jgi:hypothetical protein
MSHSPSVTEVVRDDATTRWSMPLTTTFLSKVGSGRVTMTGRSSVREVVRRDKPCALERVVADHSRSQGGELASLDDFVADGD